MLIYAGVTSLWHVPRMLLISINRHARMGTISMLVAGGSLGVAWLVGRIASLVAIAWVLVASECLMLLLVRALAAQVIDGRAKHWIDQKRA
jgi:hypothetical protein